MREHAILLVVEHAAARPAATVGGCRRWSPRAVGRATASNECQKEEPLQAMRTSESATSGYPTRTSENMRL